MKLWRVDSLFFVFVLLMFFFKTDEVYGQKQSSVFSTVELDSISHYYDLSKDKSLPHSVRMKYIDSFLERVIELKQDSLIYNGFMRKTFLLSSKKLYSSAIACSHKLLDFAKLKGDSTYIKKALKKLGLYHKRKDQLTDAFQYYNEAFKISRAINDSIEAGKSLLSMSNIQDVLGDYSGSKTTATDGLKYMETTSDLKNLSGLYHNIAIANFEQKNYEEALKYNTEALVLTNDENAKKIIGVWNILTFKNTKANILAGKKKFKQAISIFSGLLSDSLIRKDTVSYARVLDNLGYIKWLQDPENVESEKLLLKGLMLRKDIDDTWGLIASNIHLTKYHLQTNRPKALEYAELAYQNAKQQHSMTSILEALGFVFELKEDTSEEARIFSKVHLELTEMNQKNREIYAVTRYENDKLTNKNLILSAETARQRTQKTIYLFGGILLFLIAGFVIYFLQQQYKRGKIREVYKTENRISKKVHDELANDVYNLMIQVQNDHDSLKVLDKLENIYIKTRDISRENNSFDIKGNYPQELSSMLASYGSNQTQLIIRGLDDINWHRINPEKKITLHRGLQELMTNMKKHSEATLVAITFQKIPKAIKISYSDNGVGASFGHMNYSNGLRNVENRIKTIDGTFIFDTKLGKGFKAYIQFPT